jgi:hypothetical protein
LKEKLSYNKVWLQRAKNVERKMQFFSWQIRSSVARAFSANWHLLGQNIENNFVEKNILKGKNIKIEKSDCCNRL